MCFINFRFTFTIPRVRMIAPRVKMVEFADMGIQTKTSVDLLKVGIQTKTSVDLLKVSN